VNGRIHQLQIGEARDALAHALEIKSHQGRAAANRLSPQQIKMRSSSSYGGSGPARRQPAGASGLAGNRQQATGNGLNRQQATGKGNFFNKEAARVLLSAI
jgi:hypothetical protein